jgi:hypothetical protein
MVEEIEDEFHSEFVGASLRGEQCPGTLRVLWQLNSYGCFLLCLGLNIRSVRTTPAQTPMQLSCLAMIVEQAISVFIRTRPH